ncbi:head-to-tail adaptor [Microbacterium phage Gretchen]|uniref:Head-to-tail adaptor n=1 Tax=Microbacterium phage Percival TaxID=2201439 RepID=A0A2Z4Q6I2_9CAUD|nr:head-to-tail adaptor [Microbacterium phage Percival]UDL14782.1 head-to-tail adaptor [Microbacterium phage Gretchen]
MTAPLPPSLEDLALRMGLEAIDLDEDDARARLQAALDDATALVLAEVSPALAERWSASAPQVVHIVIRSAARRAYENPRGIQQETLGEHTVGLTDTSGVFLTTREMALIRKAATGRSGGYTGSLRTPSAYGIPAERVTAYVPVNGSSPFPLLDATATVAWTT